MSAATTLLWELEMRGVRLLAEDGNLDVDGPDAVLTDATLANLAQHKAEIVSILIDREVTPEAEREAIQSEGSILAPWEGNYEFPTATEAPAIELPDLSPTEVDLALWDSSIPIADIQPCPVCGTTDPWWTVGGDQTCGRCQPNHSQAVADYADKLRDGTTAYPRSRREWPNLLLPVPEPKT